MVQWVLRATPRFYVLDLQLVGRVEGEPRKAAADFAVELEKFGCCCGPDLLINSDELREARKAVKSLIDTLLASYCSVSDDFDVGSTEMDEKGITRMPRIGKGKHNIHFCSDTSPQHDALARLADRGSFQHLLSVNGRTAALRETGVTITRPAQRIARVSSIGTPSSSSSAAPGSSVENPPIVHECEETFGEGMEWHSDGGAGEYTVLLALDGILETQGALLLIPGSHEDYSEDRKDLTHAQPSCTSDSQAEARCGMEDDVTHFNNPYSRVEMRGEGHGDAKELDPNPNPSPSLADLPPTNRRPRARHIYAPAEPLFIDARTLHAVEPNKSNKWRIVSWFIFDSY